MQDEQTQDWDSSSWRYNLGAYSCEPEQYFIFGLMKFSYRADLVPVFSFGENDVRLLGKVLHDTVG